MGRKKKGEGSGEAIVEALEAQFGLPDPEPVEWHALYSPDVLPGLVAEVADLEAQLDLGHPGWRNRKPFADVTREKQAWIKLRLKRRDLILHGQADWGCYIVEVGKERKPMISVVRPTRSGLGRDSAPYRPLVTVPMLATAHKLTVAEVEAALSVMPPEVRDASGWVSGFGRVAAAAPASLPDGQPLPAPISGGVE